MKFKEAHLNFLNYLEVIKNKSQRTIEQYDRHLRKFESFLMESLETDPSIFDVEKIDLNTAEKFRSYLYEKNRSISISTANYYMITLRSFLKYLEKK
ncbi:site-specific integrase [bacterium]|jgi:site-specific recombinase XerD|nr:site-specific integrase [bacterium]